MKTNIEKSHQDIQERDLNPNWQFKPAERDYEPEIMVNEEFKMPIKSARSPASTGLSYAAKNRLVDDMGKLVFDRRFKGFINHKEEIMRKNQQRREAVRERRQQKQEDEPDEFIVEDDVLSNEEEDF